MRSSAFVFRFFELTVAFLFISHQQVAATPQLIERESSTHEYDVVIYGNTVAAIAAAIQVVRMGKTAALVTPRSTIGGLTTSGLSWTDAKNGSAVTGIAREFYSKVYERYERNDLWVEETRKQYLEKRIRAQPGPAIDETHKVQWTFEPKVAEAILEEWIKDEKIPVFRETAIKRSKDGVTKDGATITSMVSEDGTVFRGKMFIDAGYEGDLMAAAGVPFSVGRESREQYDESDAGVRVDIKSSHLNIDPYRKKGDPGSGFIDGIQEVIKNPEAVDGDADDVRLQSFNYRLCLTKEKENQIPFSKPDDYNEDTYEILFRYTESGYQGRLFTASPLPNYKTDTNAAGDVSTDLLGGNFNNNSNYAEWSYEERKQADQRHKAWTQGLLYTLSKHPRVPQRIRKRVSLWGYAKDEFVSNDHWPYELYIREARRMKGAYVMKQKDVTNPETYAEDSIVAMGSYTFDVHQVQRVVVDSHPYNEGFVHVPNRAPFPIPLKAIIPEAKDASNFLNPVTLSSTHIGFSAIRMEPTYMMLGQSAGAAAVLAIEKNVKIQDVDRKALNGRLKADGHVDNGVSSIKPLGLVSICSIAWICSFVL